MASPHRSPHRPHSTRNNNVPSTTSFTKFDPEFGEEDENALRELLIQRCLELCRHQQRTNDSRKHKPRTAVDQIRTHIKNVVCQEFGPQRYERYKSLVEYFINKCIVDGDKQKEEQRKQHREESKYGTGTATNAGSDTTTYSNSKSSRITILSSEDHNDNNDNNDNNPIELPRLVACVANCGFWGTPKTKNLCNKCFQNLVTMDVKHITKEEATQHMLASLGFNNIDEYRLDLAFSKRFPNEVKGEHTRNTLPGVKQWFNTARPLTQFDKAPERGTTACTYISGVTAIRALTRKEYAADPSEWADCILRGVVAFHAAARSNTQLKGYSHISEALPYVMEVLGYRSSDASTFKTKEKIVLLYNVVNSALDGRLPSECFGSDYVDEVGKKGLIPTLRKVLEISSALVITRPPETWSVTLDPKTSIVRMRDSHRKQQMDFDDVNSFLSWVAVDRAFFASVPSSGIDFNSVSITWFSKKTEKEIMIEKKEAIEKEHREAREAREARETREAKEARDAREAREAKQEQVMDVHRTSKQVGRGDSQEFVFLDRSPVAHRRVPQSPPLSSSRSLPVSYDLNATNDANNTNDDGWDDTLFQRSGNDNDHGHGNRSAHGGGRVEGKRQQLQQRPSTAPLSSSTASSVSSTASSTASSSEAPIQVEHRVYIGGYNVAKQKSLLLQHGITHVLNCAPSQCRCDHLNDSRFTYTLIRVFDKKDNTAAFRGTASDFISRALTAKAHNRVLIHCESGISLAPTVAMAWMMDRRNQSLATAYATVLQKKADACPSNNMFDELLSLERIIHGTNTMDSDERSTDIILDGILNGFQVERAKVLQYVKQFGTENAQRKLLFELM